MIEDHSPTPVPRLLPFHQRVGSVSIFTLSKRDALAILRHPPAAYLRLFSLSPDFLAFSCSPHFAHGPALPPLSPTSRLRALLKRSPTGLALHTECPCRSHRLNSRGGITPRQSNSRAPAGRVFLVSFAKIPITECSDYAAPNATLVGPFIKVDSALGATQSLQPALFSSKSSV